MIILNMFDEYGKGMGLPSMRESFCDAPYEGMDVIARYLDQGIPTFAQAHHPTDFFTGERIPCESVGMTDGEYSWMSTLSYYVRKYNLRLMPDFEKKVLHTVH